MEKEYNKESDYIKYKKEVNKTSKKVRQAKQDFERKIANNVNRLKILLYICNIKILSKIFHGSA